MTTTDNNNNNDDVITIKVCLNIGFFCTSRGVLKSLDFTMDLKSIATYSIH